MSTFRAVLTKKYKVTTSKPSGTNRKQTIQITASKLERLVPVFQGTSQPFYNCNKVVTSYNVTNKKYILNLKNTVGSKLPQFHNHNF